MKKGAPFETLCFILWKVLQASNSEYQYLKKSVGILKRKDSPPIVLKTEEPRFRLFSFLFLLSGGLPELGMQFTTNGN